MQSSTVIFLKWRVRFVGRAEPREGFSWETWNWNLARHVTQNGGCATVAMGLGGRHLSSWLNAWLATVSSNRKPLIAGLGKGVPVFVASVVLLHWKSLLALWRVCLCASWCDGRTHLYEPLYSCVSYTFRKTLTCGKGLPELSQFKSEGGMWRCIGLDAFSPSREEV